MKQRISSIAFLSLLGLLILSQNTFAHCDGLDGPVVIAAKKALETENVNLVLIWVQEENIEHITHVFNHTLSVRKLNADAQKLADRFFFETLVRIHRAGEGASYNGLKPAGRDLGPAIPAADKALETGSAKELLKLLNDEVTHGLQSRFKKAMELKNYDVNNVAAGQEFVKAYVEYFHFAEGIYEATQKIGHGHPADDNLDNEHHENHQN
ncbi:MAG: DUF6448 family protein [Melioribacteraceae bacterium]|jgi:hypothetical protein|nr:hypothetical protein [Ignavibacteriaceae bacterium]MBZ0182884.1 DUF6448 family protein [Melioribacteraceae bacterium]